MGGRVQEGHLMPWYRVNGHAVHLKLSGKAAKNPPRPCVAAITIDGKACRCAGISAYLCDHELSDGKTCDAPLCAEHARQVGPDRHLCPIHAGQRAEREPELF
jgi:hypothetical protein